MWRDVDWLFELSFCKLFSIIRGLTNTKGLKFKFKPENLLKGPSLYQKVKIMQGKNLFIASTLA